MSTPYWQVTIPLMAMCGRLRRRGMFLTVMAAVIDCVTYQQAAYSHTQYIHYRTDFMSPGHASELIWNRDTDC